MVRPGSRTSEPVPADMTRKPARLFPKSGIVVILLMVIPTTTHCVLPWIDSESHWLRAMLDIGLHAHLIASTYNAKQRPPFPLWTSDPID